MSDQMTPSAMFAAPFAWTSSAPDLVLTFASGTSPVNVNVASGTYRILLHAPASDFLKVLETAINAAIAAAGHAAAVTVTMRSDGYVLFTASASMSMTGIHSTALGSLLGFTDSVLTAFTTRRGERFPRHVALLCGQQTEPWAPTREMAVEIAAGGTTYGTMGAQETHESTAVFSFIPDEPGATSDYLTPWAPARTNLSTVGTHTGAWSVRDMLRLAIGQTWAYAHDYQTVRASTTERYDLVSVHPETIRSPRISRTIPDVIRYTTWTARLVRVSPYTDDRS